MIRKEISDEIDSLVLNEKNDALKTHGSFRSDHEAYAIIKEEVEEASEELSLMSTCLDTIWNRTKRDMNITVDVKELESLSKRCACECIQVAAMCKKKTD